MTNKKATNKLVNPFVKWVGGKRQLLHEIDKHIPSRFSTYYEPFVGGGAVLFHIQPKSFIINDNNTELANLYEVIKNNPEELINDLKKHVNDEDYYYDIRGIDRDKDRYQKMDSIQRASRILFLNKTCYNGLFRVNSLGEFNAPFGRYKKPNIVNHITIRAVSKYFSKCKCDIHNCDFEESLSSIRKGSFVYIDPPYDPISNSSSFTGYTKNGFNREEQIRLKCVCDALTQKGVKFLLSNSSTVFIKSLYKEYNVLSVNARRAINSKANGRGKIAEVLIKNYE